MSAVEQVELRWARKVLAAFWLFVMVVQDRRNCVQKKGRNKIQSQNIIHMIMIQTVTTTRGIAEEEGEE